MMNGYLKVRSFIKGLCKEIKRIPPKVPAQVAEVPFLKFQGTEI